MSYCGLGMGGWVGGFTFAWMEVIHSPLASTFHPAAVRPCLFWGGGGGGGWVGGEEQEEEEDRFLL